MTEPKDPLEPIAQAFASGKIKIGVALVEAFKAGWRHGVHEAAVDAVARAGASETLLRIVREDLPQ